MHACSILLSVIAVFFFTAFCFDLDVVDNGNTAYNTISQPLNNTHLNGTTATVNCDTGYNLEGPKVRTCVIGNWTNETSKCIESKFTVQQILAIYMQWNREIKDRSCPYWEVLCI